MKKKIFAVTMIFVLLFACAFAGCSKSSGEVNIYPVLSTENAKPGDTVQVAVYVDNAELFCSMGFFLSYDAAYVTYKDAQTAIVPELISELRDGADAAGNSFIEFTGITLKTLDLQECLLFTAEFTVREDAPAGEPFFGIAVEEFCKGNDAEGASYTDIVADVVEGGTKLTVTVG